MDTTVTGIASVVVEELRAAGYMESTIGQYEKTIKGLTRFVEERGSTYTPSLGAAFASMTVSPRTGRFSAQRRFDYGRLVNVFDTYVRTGRVDLSCRKRGGGGARPDSSEFTALAAAWEADMDDRGLAPAPATPMVGYPAATWCSWNHAGSTVSATLTGPAFWGFSDFCPAGGRRPPCSGWCRTSARS
jgi:hypothetical protein